MAILKVNDDGSIGIKKNKNKKKTADLIVGEDGKITFNADKVKSSLSQNNDIAPVRTDIKRSWFKSGLFEDGYDFGDITKTILGTNKDFADDFFSGVAGIGEGVVDTAAYAAGGIAKKLGKDEFAKKTQKFIERDLVEEYQLGDKLARQVNPGIKGISLLNDLVNKSDSEKASVLGEKTDSLVQSGGQLAGTFALQSVGVPWWLTTGVTSFGGGTEEAFQNDATYGEAGVYGLINAGAEILTEKIFGGIKFGGKALDEGLKKKLAGGIANKTLRTLTKFGWDMAGEGTEEVLSDVITNIGKKLTYEDESTLKELVLSEEAMDGYLESFIGGAVLGGGFNVGKLRNSVKTGRDYDTGLTDNEQSVVDAEIKSRTAEKQKNAAVKERISRVIAEQEKTFGTLSETEKKRIKERVQMQLDNGEIDFTTAQLSKQEQAEIEKQVREDLEKGYIGIDSIESTLASEKTAKIKELESQLTNIADDAKKAKIQSEIKQLVADRATQLTGALSKDGYLQESYRQEALKKKEFSREVKEEDSDITKELLESAKNSKMNDTRRMHELFEYTNKIANDTGTRYGFVNNEQLKQLGHDVEGRTINGLVRVSEDGTTKILINVDSDKSLNTIIGHETTHLFEGTSEYKALQDIAKEYAITKGEYDSRLKQIQSLYEGTNANVENEITADLVGDYLFTDEQFINSLSTKQPNVFQKIYDYIKHAYKMATAGSKEARQLEQLKRRFDKAYKEMGKATAGEVDSNLTTEADSNTKYSLNDNTVSLTSERIDSVISDYGASDKRYAKAYITSINPRDYLKLTISDKNLAKWEQAADEGTSESIYPLDEAKLKNERNIPMLEIDTETGEVIGHEGRHRMMALMRAGATNVPIVVVDNTTKYSKKKEPSMVISSQDFGNDPVNGGFTTEIRNLIPTNKIYKEDIQQAYGKDADIRFSLSDNQGRKLTKKQQEYFKDSKVRDENGNLMVMYHGTPNGTFNEFRPSYFTPMKWYADRYQSQGASSLGYKKTANNPTTYEVYLNIKKPFDTREPEARRIFEEEYYQQWGTGTPLMESGLPDWMDGEDLIEFLEEKGYDYDGIILDEGGVGGYGEEVVSRGLSYVPLSPEQVKRVDNTNPTDSPDIRYSLSEADSKYNSAVKSGDIETAQRLVDEAAKNAGYTIKAYHGSRQVFNEFSRDKRGSNTHTKVSNDWFFASDKETANSYYPYGVMKELAKQSPNIWKDSDAERMKQKGKLYNLYIKMENPLVVDVADYDYAAHRETADAWHEYTVQAEENGNDGIILLNAMDNQLKTGARESTVYMFKDPNQAKSAEPITYDNSGNVIPLSERFNSRKRDIRFSLSSPVEENKNLMAIHNLHASEVLKQLDLGGMPMPSIAVTDPAKVDHEGFGDITLILDKDTIDPKKSKYNKVYSGDAYTPTFPRIEYEANEAESEAVYKTLTDATKGSPEEVRRNVLKYHPGNIDDELNRWGGEAGLIESLLDDRSMKQTYLYTKGQYVEDIFKTTETKLTEEQKLEYDTLISELGEDTVRSLKAPASESPIKYRQAWIKEHEREIRDAYKTYLGNSLRSDGHDITDGELNSIIEAETPAFFYKEVRAALNYLNNGDTTVKVEYDGEATRQEIENRIDEAEYKQWLENLFKGIERKSGLRNNVDPFTRSGNRRGFDALHDPVTLDNIVKAMRGDEQQKGQGFLGGNLSGAAAQEYGSIEDIKKDSGRIGKLTEEEHKQNNKYIEDTLNEIAMRYADGKDWWDARNTLVEAVAMRETKKGIKGYLKEYDYVYKLDDSIVDDLVNLRDYIRSLPVPYFEAKPQRAVGFDEVGVFVIPNNADAALKQKLLESGYSIAEYNPDIEGDRQRVVNEFEKYKFSLSKPGENIPTDGYSVYGRDVKLQEEIAPIREDIQDLKNTLSDLRENVATLAPEPEGYKALTEEDLPYIEQEREESFRNITEDSAPVEQEYYNMPDTAPLDDKSLKLLSKNMRQELGLKNNQVAGLRKIIQDFSTSETASKEDLYNAIESEFGTIYEKKKLDTVQEIKAALRSMRINVSDTIKSDIPDYFQFKQRNFGKIRFANDGLAVDDVYEGLKDIYPEYFPDDIANPTDQLLKIADVVNMDANYIEEYALPEEQIQDVTDYIYESISDYKRQKRQEASENAAKAPIDESMIPYEVPEPVEDIAPVREDLKQKESNSEAEPEDLVTKTKKELRKQLLVDESDFFAKALDNAKNRSMILMNNTDTIRNTELVFGRENGKKINDLIFQKEIDNEAKSIAWQNKERAEIKALGIKARSKESAAVQKWGEGKYVDEFGDLVEYKDSDLMTEFPDVETQKKIKNAAKVIRDKYDNYIAAANDVLTQLGFEPIKKRDDYMRHFQELTDVFSRYGIPFNAQNMQEHVLPTDINGLTEFWSPQKNYFANMQPRKGIRTTLDAITGIDGYIGGVANLIYHTEDIQRGRAFEETIRDTYGEDKGWDNLENLPEDQQMARAEKIQDNHLSNYAAWVHEWTNNIAGKKSKIDRSVESMFGRKAFSFLDQIRKQVGANMIGLNLSSSLTNLIASVQATAKTNKLAVAKGTADTIKNIFIKDNFMEKNNFLTSRMGTDMLSKTAWQKIQDAGFVFMKGMDWFSSNQIVRSKYYELRSKGMSEEQAHTEAGKFAARIMGDRTKGANAQLYNSKMVGLVTQFQLEVNNQLYSMFYDTYHESKENAKNNALRTAAGMTFTLGQLFAFTHLFGKTFESIAGYNPTFDIIGIIATALGVGDDDDDKSTSERLKEAADQLVDALPYVNILTGGGRIPIASGIPNIVGVMTGGKDDYGNELTLEDELKKLLYLVPPTGGNQIKKTTQGLKMFDEDNPVPGSYTDNGNLRFPVEDTPLNRIQAGLFGQWSNENAREYFDNKRQPLKEKQIQEYKDLDLPIADYWKYRDGLKEQKTLEDKFNYIADLDLPVSKKNIMINNIVDRKEKVDMINYDDFSSYEEFDFATKNPEKYSFLESMGVSYKDYKSSDEAKEAYDWAFNNPEKYSLAKAAAGDVVTYRSYTSALNELKADKDSNGKTISGSRKAKVADYINGLSADYGEKIILFKSEYPSDDTYNYEIIDYLNNREDITYSEMETILKELGFTVDAAGNVRW